MRPRWNQPKKYALIAFQIFRLLQKNVNSVPQVFKWRKNRKKLSYVGGLVL